LATANANNANNANNAANTVMTDDANNAANADVVPDFVAIDFETANRSPRSAVAMGLTRVVAGEPTKRVATLLRPPTRAFTFTKIHGIGPTDVADAPEFRSAWHAAKELLSGAVFLAAHNSAFDMEVLRASCAAAKESFPRQPWLCTVALARAVWSIVPTRLPSVCRRLGVPLVQHHNAGSDADACAAIVCAAWQTETGRSWLRRFRR